MNIDIKKYNVINIPIELRKYYLFEIKNNDIIFSKLNNFKEVIEYSSCVYMRHNYYDLGYKVNNEFIVIRSLSPKDYLSNISKNEILIIKQTKLRHNLKKMLRYSA